MGRCHTTAPQKYDSRRSKVSAFIIPVSLSRLILFVAAQLPGHLPATLPVLFIWGADDPTVVSELISRMREVTPKFEEIKLPGRHWLMAQARDEVTEAVLKWLDVGAVSKL